LSELQIIIIYCHSRLKLLEKKKTELALKSRKEIADYVSAGKTERAKIRVEHIIREDYLVEAMEILEMYCDLLLARCKVS
jgi:vacuolar protein sorting-associated protein IST1